MQKYLSLFKFIPKNKSILTLGTFDGVHLGHQELLKKLKKASENCDCETVVLTFYPHPRMVLKQDNEIKLLNTLEEKIELLEQNEVQNLIIHPFDQTFSELSPLDFVEKILVNQLNIKKIIIGYDHKFGKNRAADIHDLILFGKQFNFEVEQISAEEINNITVSSTKIRNAISEGNIEIANAYLGYQYSISGTIIEGKKIGRTIGFPTANLNVENINKLIPKKGSYIIKCVIDKREIYGMLNIGKNPTVQGNKESIEVHLFNFNEDIYHKNVTIYFLKRIRDEQKFNSLEELKNQLQLDKSFASEFIKNSI